jgi:hypothetical protein
VGTFRVLPAPGLAGLVPLSAASAWGYGSWVEIIQTSEACSILGVTYQWTAIPAVDVTEEIIFDIGTGAAGSESVKVQITQSFRQDTAVGYYLTTIAPMLPEPYSISAGTRIAVRAADSNAAARTYQGFRLLIDQITPAGPQDFGLNVNQAVNRSAVI